MKPPKIKNEKDLTKFFTKMVECQFWVKSFEISAPDGWPDLLLQRTGFDKDPWTVWIEAKVIKKDNHKVKFQPKQRKTLDQIITNRGRAFVLVYSLESRNLRLFSGTMDMTEALEAEPNGPMFSLAEGLPETPLTFIEICQKLSV